MDAVTAPTGRQRDAHVARVSGSLVEVEGLDEATMAEVVRLGDQRLQGEVVGVRSAWTTVQAYEDTGGLSPGVAVLPTGAPVSAPLGPGLLGGIFDGLLRPLTTAPTWLTPGAGPGEASAARWPFEPAAEADTDVVPGRRLGTVAVPGWLPLHVLVPPGVAGRLRGVLPPGEYPVDAVVAHVGDRPVRLVERWPVRRPRPWRERLVAGEPVHTGQRVLDLLYPLSRGSTAAVPGGFGTGKTVLLQQIAKWCDADVIVYVGCGERGNEMADVVAELSDLEDPRTGDRLIRRTVVIANTSNMPVMAREISIYTGVTVAEYFRDMGYHVVVIADSTSRWAEALREFASRTGALPAEEGYPSTLASALAAFYERAGGVETLGGDRGSVTILGAVSPPGGDLTEPVTAHTQRFVRAVWSLDRDLAYARHYPAVGWNGSFSRDAAASDGWHAAHGDPGWGGRRAQVLATLAEADRLEALAELVGLASLPGAERVTMLAGRLLREGVLQQSALSAVDASCDAARGAALTEAVLAVVERCRTLIEQGVPASVVEESDFGPLLRAREEAADVAAVEQVRSTVLARLEELR